MSNCNYCKRLRRFAWPLPLLAGAVLLPGAVIAIDTAGLVLEAAVGSGWQARDIHLTLGTTGGALKGFSLSIAQLAIDGMPTPIRSLRVECPTFELARTTVSCGQAAIDAVMPALGRQRFTGVIRYDITNGAVALAVDRLVVGAGTVGLKAELRDGRWQGDVTLRDVAIEALLALAKDWALPLPALTATGKVDLAAQARGQGVNPAMVEFSGTFSELTAGNEAGTLASDRLSLKIAGRIEQQQGWRFEISASSAQGQAYAEPVFLDFGVHTFDASVKGFWKTDGSLDIEQFAVIHSDVLEMEGRARLDPGRQEPLVDLDATFANVVFPGIYTSYLQPFLLGTQFKALQTGGRIAGHVTVTEGLPQLAELVITDVNVDDGAGNLALYGLAGEVSWRALSTATASASRLSWSGGLLLGLDLGAATLHFRTQNRDFELLEPARIPVLDGALELERFEISSAGDPQMAFSLDANVLPISVQRLSRAFGWPEFGGQLSGRISDLRLDNGILTLATTLRAQVFDGRLEISDLKIEDPFGNWPRLYSSIDIYNLDLEQVTSAFSFGLITGRLSGYVNEMVLFDWMPVEFDLRLYTPPEDRSRHRISQRAVQNIGNLGGGGAGVGAALSSGFMSFFDEFNYASLGISCRLENEVCLMDGVEPAPHGGYYLVKGRGIPRIDVIGNAARVDWPRLVAQLQAIAASEGPIVE